MLFSLDRFPLMAGGCVRLEGILCEDRYTQWSDPEVTPQIEEPD